jgi:hypothetical protein
MNWPTEENRRDLNVLGPYPTINIDFESNAASAKVAVLSVGAILRLA